jgi:hypothetical protein
MEEAAVPSMFWCVIGLGSEFRAVASLPCRTGEQTYVLQPAGPGLGVRDLQSDGLRGCLPLSLGHVRSRETVHVVDFLKVLCHLLDGARGTIGHGTPKVVSPELSSALLFTFPVADWPPDPALLAPLPLSYMSVCKEVL